MSPPANISQLQDLPPPAAVSYLPQTWGWWALLVLLLVVGLCYAGRGLYRWRRNRYRRAALAELSRLALALTEPAQVVTALRQLPELLKRTALSMPDPPAVASFSGQAWQQFLQASSPTRLPDDFAQQLALLAYAPDQQLQSLPTAQIKQLLASSRLWLEQHHVAV
ncbi:MAG: DUF4381 domain-containing protein [Pseudomonas sp.]|uniref:DUF4381 domain-containing protein n=1 Tax=Pseudomonas sp. TaxID=306 RepID=UPI0027340322|nr:DUF4381 domain-containing protein [Pseudomonas sp.]MDP3847335.1 DUF4381 domain-containing protein [Pseudomonas sp.]